MSLRSLHLKILNVLWLFYSLPAGITVVSWSHKFYLVRLLAEIFEALQLHDEVKSQIQDLSDAIASQLQTQQESRYKQIEVRFLGAML